MVDPRSNNIPEIQKQWLIVSGKRLVPEQLSSLIENRLSSIEL
jgi:hypothetical protein